jgi:hypothetical protein
MAVLLSIFEQALLLGSLVLFTGYVLWHTTHGTNSKELVLRLMALFVGAMVVIGAQVAGVDFATFSVNALSSARHVSAPAKVASVIVPGAIGIVMGWYLTRSLRRDEDIAMRIMGFVAMLAATQFAAIYVVAMGKRGLELGVTALPNLSFIIGIFLYVIFTYDSKQRRVIRHSAAPGWRNLARPPAPRQATPPPVTNLFQEADDALRGRLSPPRPPSGDPNLDSTRSSDPEP